MRDELMWAHVVEEPGGSEVLKDREVPIPQPQPAWVLIRIKAFGLNRSELHTRLGYSGDAVPFPRMLGIECVGEVADAPESDLQPGQRVAAATGGMGRRCAVQLAEQVKPTNAGEVGNDRGVGNDTHNQALEYARGASISCCASSIVSAPKRGWIPFSNKMSFICAQLTPARLAALAREISSL